MSFGFEVKSANGVTQLDTTTWGWQFIRAIAINFTRRYRGIENTGGSIVFDGTGGKPMIPASADLYAINVLNQNDRPHMMVQTFSYTSSGSFKRLNYSDVTITIYTGDNQYYDPDRWYRTTIYVFTR